MIRERAELAAPGVPLPESGLAPCGGPLDPPCPPDPCELPGDGDCDLSEIAVTMPGRLAFRLTRIATRGTSGDPAYVRLDGADGTAGVELVVEVRAADGSVRLDTLAVEAALGLIYERMAEDGTGDLVRRYEQPEASAPRIRTDTLAPGDTLLRVWTQGVGGNRVPVDHPMSTGVAGSGVMVGLLGVSGPAEVFQFSDSSWGEPFTTYVGTFEPELRLMATPDTLAAGAEAELALEGAVPPPETPVVLTLSDGDVGTLAGACAAPAARQGAATVASAGASVSFTTTVGGLADCRFVAADLVEAATVTITAELDGQSVSADVIVEPLLLAVRLLRQNDTAVPLPADGGYLMVSKVRPDWLWTSSTVPFDTPFGEEPFRNASLSEPPDGDFHDPDTYRVQVSGFPNRESAESAAGRLRFTFEPPGSPKVVVGAGGARGGGTAPTGLTSESIGLDTETNTWGVRAGGFVRLVSNDRPERGAAGRYDDQENDGQTILVRLLDDVRVTAYLEADDDTPEQAVGDVLYRVGDASSSPGKDAVRRVDLAWHTYERADGTALGSDPAESTQRASEDWAQASVHFETASEATFSSAGVRNAVQIIVAGATTATGPTPRTTAAGVLRVEVKVPGTPVVGEARYPAGASGADIANLLAADLGPKLGSLTDNVVALGATDGVEGPESFGVVVAGRAAQVPGGVRVLTPDTGEVRSVVGLPDLSNVRFGSRAGYVALLAAKDADAGSIDVVVMPLSAINDGAPTGSVPGQTTRTTNGEAFPDIDTPDRPYLSDGVANSIRLRIEAVDGDDRDYPMTLGHELGHVLIGAFLPTEDGEPTSDPAHSGVPYNLMSGQVLGAGESLGGRKRLTPAAHEATRCESGSPADDISPSLCASLGVRHDRTRPPLLRVPATSPLAEAGPDR